MLKKQKCLCALLIITLVIISGCATTGPGGKTSFIIIPVSQEIAIGAGMASQVEETENILQDSLWQSYLNEVGQKIVAVSDRKDIKYHFKVIESDQINAFAAPGGYIYFYTGLLKMMDNEAEMAAVMAHEISHVVGRHGIKRLQAALGVSLAYQLAFGGDGANDIVNAAIGLGMGLTFASYSRGNESEADDYGFTYLIKAGYNPNSAISMYEKLAAKGGGDQNVFEKLSSSHPETQSRIANAKTRVENMQPFPDGLTLGTKRYIEMKSRLK